MTQKFNKIARITLVLVYCVIIAGGLVRMTGSGMGCPDWPKCFGYLIPPTDVQELTWEPHHKYQKGQVIIKDEKLWVAKTTFTSKDQYDATHWEQYKKHNYATFNAAHTWTEYLNRLTGAIAGIACVYMAVVSLRLRKVSFWIPLLSWLVVFLMGFQAWLGATVVFSVLNPVKITVHMVMALVIVAFILYIIRLSNPQKEKAISQPLFKSLLYFSILLTLLQVVLGTQVRQFVDTQVQSGITDAALWLQNPEISFYFHRTFSFVVFFVNLFLLLRNYRLKLGFDKLRWVMWLLLAEIATGIAMYYFDFPFGSQALHLVIASIMFGVQFYLILETVKISNKN